MGQFHLECLGTVFMMARLMNYFPHLHPAHKSDFSECVGCSEWESYYTQLKALMRNQINLGTIYYESTWRQFAGAT